MFTRPGEIINFLKEKGYLHSGMNGADFGCGSGYFSVLLANIVGPQGLIYAIDIQEDVLNEAKEFANNFKIKNIRFLKQDLEKNSGLENNSVDFVFISQVLYQSENPELILKEAYRVLKNNGLLIIYEPKESNFLFLGQNVHPQEKIEEICKNIGFKIIEDRDWGAYFLLIFEK